MDSPANVTGTLTPKPEAMVGHVQFHALQSPEEFFRVRDLNEVRVATLVKGFLTEGTGVLTTSLILMRDNDKYVVIDGNHRFEAMKKIRDLEDHSQWFDSVDATIYPPLTTSQALAIGYIKNDMDADVLRMTDFDKVELIRKILHSLDSRSDAFSTVYFMLDVSGREGKQKLQQHFHVAGLSLAEYNIIKPRLKAKKIKSSTLNCLRGLTAEQKQNSLIAYQNSGWDKKTLLAISGQHKGTSKSKVMPVEITFPNDTVMIQQGKKGIKIDKHFVVKIGPKSINGEDLFNLLQGMSSDMRSSTPKDVYKFDGGDTQLSPLRPLTRTERAFPVKILDLSAIPGSQTTQNDSLVTNDAALLTAENHEDEVELSDKSLEEPEENEDYTYVSPVEVALNENNKVMEEPEDNGDNTFVHEDEVELGDDDQSLAEPEENEDDTYVPAIEEEQRDNNKSMEASDENNEETDCPVLESRQKKRGKRDNVEHRIEDSPKKRRSGKDAESDKCPIKFRHIIRYPLKIVKDDIVATDRELEDTEPWLCQVQKVSSLYVVVRWWIQQSGIWGPDKNYKKTEKIQRSIVLAKMKEWTGGRMPNTLYDELLKIY